MEPLSPLDMHLSGLAGALLPYRAVAGRLARWGGQLAWHLGQGGRLLVAGNGGSAVNVAVASSTANVDRTTMANNNVALTATASGATILSIGNNIFNNTSDFVFSGGGIIASDGQNRTGGNTFGQDAGASVTLK